MMKDFPDDTFLARWLNGELDESELRKLEQRDDYQQLQRIVAAAGQLDTPPYSEEEAWKRFRTMRQQSEIRQDRPRIGYRWLYGAVAAVLLLIGFFLFRPDEAAIALQAGYGEKKVLLLPDSSRVVLNARSLLSYTDRDWEQDRTLFLEGEAFFEVTSGSTFRVETSRGWIEVLGTRFNVYSRGEKFEVECYSGKVKVDYRDTTAFLSAGNMVSGTQGGDLVGSRFLPPAAPSWTRGESRFSDTPIGTVVEELERQYDITIQYEGPVDKKITVGFPHDNLEAALRLFTGASGTVFEYRDSSTVLITTE